MRGAWDPLNTGRYSCDRAFLVFFAHLQGTNFVERRWLIILPPIIPIPFFPFPKNVKYAHFNNDYSMSQFHQGDTWYAAGRRINHHGSDPLGPKLSCPHNTCGHTRSLAVHMEKMRIEEWWICFRGPRFRAGILSAHCRSRPSWVPRIKLSQRELKNAVVAIAVAQALFCSELRRKMSLNCRANTTVEEGSIFPQSLVTPELAVYIHYCMRSFRFQTSNTALQIRTTKSIALERSTT